MYEYKVVPAPQRAVKAKGLRTTAERFAHALAERINAEAAGGWQFVRSETLPCEERSRFGATRMSQQTVMIFAREIRASRPETAAALVAVQSPVQSPVLAPALAPVQAPAPAPTVERPAAERPTAERPPLRAEPRADLRAEPRTDEADEADAPARRRQEPLFRSGAMLRAESARAEPVLRPRAPSED